jgi:hypothetical protein
MEMDIVEIIKNACTYYYNYLDVKLDILASFVSKKNAI